MEEIEEYATQGHVEAKRELARRLMKGKEIEKNEAKAISLLNECVANGDTNASLMLALWCALGRGMEQNVDRAEAIISDCAKRGNESAMYLIGHINRWKKSKAVALDGVSWYFIRTQKHIINRMFGKNVLMNISQLSSFLFI